MKSDKLEKEIWQGLVDNNRKYQEILYRRYYSYGMSICLRYTQTREEAKEILHDGFMILFKTPRKLDPSLPFKPWFRRVLINRCINHFKKHQRKMDETGFDQIPESETNEPSPLESMQYEELLQLILRLPTAYRAVFNLYILDGYTHDEIAKLLDISVGTSKSNLSRARQKLREMLNTQGNEREFLRQER
ncbi:sigma-70 family RNA polymerase sigma factor [Algoriphagus lutimaris]|uniref:RNA polymerase sigma factor n=1 Tax=Algoriphagus lutimaris TaxID=613197 RepID=UPI00196AB175|nr:sigma-70 family RNA polymerase sigma factor [Algoriphagus lutimaris]MBN3518732.1 sigma-70 family RNA polymerase sigma factor [Algoriphagus lutimaris]